jgi:hypothetical protein
VPADGEHGTGAREREGYDVAGRLKTDACHSFGRTRPLATSQINR